MITAGITALLLNGTSFVKYIYKQQLLLGVWENQVLKKGKDALIFLSPFLHVIKCKPCHSALRTDCNLTQLRFDTVNIKYTQDTSVL